MYVSVLALSYRTEEGFDNVHNFSKKASATKQITGVTEVCKNCVYIYIYIYIYTYIYTHTHTYIYTYTHTHTHTHTHIYIYLVERKFVTGNF